MGYFASMITFKSKYFTTDLDGRSKFLPIKIVFPSERWLQVNHEHFLHYGTG